MHFSPVKLSWLGLGPAPRIGTWIRIGPAPLLVRLGYRTLDRLRDVLKARLAVHRVVGDALQGKHKAVAPLLELVDHCP